MLKRYFSLITLLLSLSFLSSAMAQNLMITEFMADNLTSDERDEDGERSDWLEIQNMGTTTVSLNGWYLTDKANDLREWQFPATSPAVTLAPGARIVVWCSGKNRKANATRLHTNFKLSNEGEFLALVRPDGVTVEHSYSPAYPPQFVDGVYGVTTQYTTTVVLPETAAGKAHVPTSAADYTTAMAGWNTSVNFDDSTWQAGQSGFGFGTPFEALIGVGGDLSASMAGISSTVCVRYTFNLPSLTGASVVRLKTKFDDGFVAYLNGTRIGGSLAPTPPAWNSTTLIGIPRPDGSAATFEVITPTGAAAALLPGNNLLAFQVFNSSTTDTNLLLRPQLEVDFASGFTSGYLTTPTRGTANSAIATNIGPSVSEVTKNPARPVGGVGSAPIRVTARVTPTLRPLHASNPVVLKWRRMYGTETAIPMTYDAVNDLYFADVPTTSLAAGEMLRWRVEARDNAATPIYSYAPPYPFTPTSPPPNPPTKPSTAAPYIDLDQYYGTVALDGITTSNLPILHWFVDPNALGNPETSAGEPCSFLFQPMAAMPEGTPGYVRPGPMFYDAIPVNIHGQSSGGFPQKSHNLSFNKDNRFLFKDGEPALRSINLLTTYADKTKIRHTLAYETWRLSGHIASGFAQPVRVQRNGTFRGLYDLVEDANEDYLQRHGLDPLGSLYKVYNSLENANQANNNGGGSEKKNPDTTDFSDLQALVTGINAAAMTDRLRYVHDNVDVPSLINFLAVHTLIMNRDFGHKNYFIFRDTQDTGEWSTLPWDQDLSFGHTWTSGQGYFDDDIHSQGPLQLGTGNRLMQIVYGSPELNAMFVSRVRSLANQFFVSATETNGPLDQRINELINAIDPNPDNPAGGTDDADLNARQWGFWVDGSSALIGHTDSRMPDHTVRAQAARLLSSNPIPPYPGANPYGNWGDGSTSLLPFLPGRRQFMFNMNPMSGTMPLPPTEPANPTLVIEGIDFKPAAGTQEQEYFVIRNPNNYAVDLSGWQLSGEVEMTFRAGTVIPRQGATTTQGTNAAYVNQLIVAKKPLAFRARSSSPRANEYRFVTGPYKGQLSSRGGSIVLSRPNNPLDPSAGYTQVATGNYAAAPTPSQQSLRISELNYDPAGPTASESAALPGVSPSDFEFIELINTGVTSLNLANARFDKGVEFVFPNTAVSTMAPGARRLVVSNLTAFRLRYGTAYDSVILGEYLGNLSNAGEEIQLLDPVGEVVLEFDYLPTWYPPASGGGRSLVATTTDHTQFGQPTAWQLSIANGGSPGYLDVPAEITQEPTGTTVNPGQPIVLEVEAIGTPTPLFQWRRDGGILDGATGPTLTIPSATEDDEGMYDVTISNASGSDTSIEVQVSVNDPVVITTPPESKTVNPGTVVTFSVAATGTGPFTYQWRRGEQNIDGATDSSYQFVATEGLEGLYDVVVTNVIGPVPSTGAALLVNDPVQFNTHPETQTVYSGTVITLSAGFTGTGPFTYQWRKGLEPIDGATGTTYQFTATEETVGTYDVVVTNIVGSQVSNGAVIAVYMPVVFTTHPLPRTVNPNTSVTFSSAVTGSGPFTYQWRRDGQDIDGANGASYELIATEEFQGVYDVVVTNILGPVTSDSAALSVNDSIVISTQPKPVTVAVGGKATFTVVADGTGPITYQWRKGGENIPNAIAATYTIDPVAETDFANYDVVVSNIVGDFPSASVALASPDWTALAGSYQGLLSAGDPADPTTHPRPGRITATVTKTGKVSGKLEYFGLKHSFKGTFDASLKANVVISRGKTAVPVNARFHLDAPISTLTVDADHDTGNGLFESEAGLAFIPKRTKSTPAAKMGRYTLVLEPGTGAPGDLTADGFLMVNVTKTGGVSWTGKMPDGGVIKGSSFLTSDDEIPFYSPMYVPKPQYVGQIAGPLAIDGTEIEGDLAWRKPTQAKLPFWGLGLNTLVEAHGGMFVPPAKNIPAIPTTALELGLIGPVPNGTHTSSVQLTTANKFTFPLPNAEKLKLTLNKTTGALTGSVFDTVLRKTWKLEGVLLQGDERGVGFFRGTDAVGAWELAE